MSNGIKAKQGGAMKTLLQVLHIRALRELAAGEVSKGTYGRLMLYTDDSATVEFEECSTALDFKHINHALRVVIELS